MALGKFQIPGLFDGPQGLTKQMIDLFGRQAELRTKVPQESDAFETTGTNEETTATTKVYIKNDRTQSQDLVPGYTVQILIPVAGLEGFPIIDNLTKIYPEKMDIVYTVMQWRAIHVVNALSHYDCTCTYNTR